MSDTGVMNPTAAGTISKTPYDDNAWLGTADIYTTNNVYASITAASFDDGDYSWLLYAYGFPVSGIPDTDIIDGILVSVERRALVAHSVIDSVAYLFDGADYVGNFPIPTDPNWGLLENFDEIVYIGGSTNKWGNPSLTGADVKAAGFGCVYACQAQENNADVFVDHITMKIWHHAAGLIITGGGSLMAIGGNVPGCQRSSIIYAPAPSALAIGSNDPNPVSGSLIIVPPNPSIMALAGDVGSTVRGSISFSPTPSAAAIASGGPSGVIFGSLSFSPVGYGFAVGSNAPIIELGSIVFSPESSKLVVASGGGVVLIGQPTSSADVVEIVQRTFGSVVFEQGVVDIIERTFGDAVIEQKSLSIGKRTIDEKLKFRK